MTQPPAFAPVIALDAPVVAGDENNTTLADSPLISGSPQYRLVYKHMNSAQHMHIQPWECVRWTKKAVHVLAHNQEKLQELECPRDPLNTFLSDSTAFNSASNARGCFSRSPSPCSLDRSEPDPNHTQRRSVSAMGWRRGPYVTPQPQPNVVATSQEEVEDCEHSASFDRARQQWYRGGARTSLGFRENDFIQEKHKSDGEPSLRLSKQSLHSSSTQSLHSNKFSQQRLLEQHQRWHQPRSRQVSELAPNLQPDVHCKFLTSLGLRTGGEGFAANGTALHPHTRILRPHSSPLAQPSVTLNSYDRTAVSVAASRSNSPRRGNARSASTGPTAAHSKSNSTAAIGDVWLQGKPRSSVSSSEQQPSTSRYRFKPFYDLHREKLCKTAPKVVTSWK